MPIELQRYTPQVGEQCGLAAFVDVETTGLSPQSDEVVEFATALFAFDRTSGRIKGVVDEYVGLRDPGRPIPAKVTEVHGIRDHDVRGKRLDDGRILELMSQAEFLVAHNAPFDSGFVERLCSCFRARMKTAFTTSNTYWTAMKGGHLLPRPRRLEHR